eukprot:tig00020629_g12333.t1
MSGSERGYGGGNSPPPSPRSTAPRARTSSRVRTLKNKLRRMIAVCKRLLPGPLALLCMIALIPLVVYLAPSLSEPGAELEVSSDVEELRAHVSHLQLRLAAETKARGELEEELRRARSKIGEITTGKQRSSIREKFSEEGCICVKTPRYVFGIPSVYREKENYLLRTLESVVETVPEDEQWRVTFIIYNGEDPPEKHLEIAKVRKKYIDEVGSSYIEIMEKALGHRELEGELKGMRNEEPARARWRSKQVLDYAHLMHYARSAGDYYVQLEDDIIAAKDWFRRLDRWVTTHFTDRCDWFMLSFYTPWNHLDMDEYPADEFFGFIGQVIRTRDLEALSNHLRKHFSEVNVQMLMANYIGDSGRKIYVHVPALFKHVGTFSSNGKRQEQNTVAFADDLPPDKQGEFAYEEH